MKRTLTLIATLAAIALATSAAQAGPHGKRLFHQRERIAQGVMCEQLTPREARVLRMEHRRIAGERWAFLANDGRIGPRERAKLSRDLDRASRHIHGLRHNGRGRG